MNWNRLLTGPYALDLSILIYTPLLIPFVKFTQVQTSLRCVTISVIFCTPHQVSHIVLVYSCAMALSTSVSCFAINHHNNTKRHLRNVLDILTTMSRFMTPDQETFPVIRKGHRYNTCYLYPPKATLSSQCRKLLHSRPLFKSICLPHQFITCVILTVSIETGIHRAE